MINMKVALFAVWIF